MPYSQCALVEAASDSLVFTNIFRDSGANYFEENQGRAAIERLIYTRLPGRFQRIPSQRFMDISRSYTREIANLLPEFLNEKKRRAGWGQAVAQMAAVSTLLITYISVTNAITSRILLSPSQYVSPPKPFVCPASLLLRAKATYLVTAATAATHQGGTDRVGTHLASS